MKGRGKRKGEIADGKDSIFNLFHFSFLSPMGFHKTITNVGKTTKAIALGLSELVAPELCRICGGKAESSEHKAICSDCRKMITYLGEQVCRCCGSVVRSKVATQSVCGECIRKPPPWDRALSLVHYSGDVRQLMHALKYRGDTTVLPALAIIAGPAIHNIDTHWDVILPVPLHNKRLRKRKMNQALVLARTLLPDHQEIIEPRILVRNRATVAQTGLDGRERRRNLRGAFGVTAPEKLKGKRVLIVDDVFTTGATAAECCREVRRAGAVEIVVLTFARVVFGEQV